MSSDGYYRTHYAPICALGSSHDSQDCRWVVVVVAAAAAAVVVVVVVVVMVVVVVVVGSSSSSSPICALVIT